MDYCYVQLMGGLGNQLFQVAAAYAFCKRNGKTLKISQRSMGASGYKPTYWDSYMRELKASISARKSGITWQEPCFAYTPIPAHTQVLAGYYQSSRYFQDYAAEIRKLFHPGSATHIKMLQRHGGILVAKPNATVVHIRRGDYFGSDDLQKRHGILTADWYRRALTKSNVRSRDLLVFSDDLAWCRNQDFLQGATFVDEPDEVVALHMMTQFRHFILSNSSFSWWAAWLAGSEDVVVPDRWFGPSGPQDTQDIYEPNWRILSLEEAK
jgi:hypothetical protein